MLWVHGECQCWCGLPKRGGSPSWRACVRKCHGAQGRALPPPPGVLREKPCAQQGSGRRAHRPASVSCFPLAPTSRSPALPAGGTQGKLVPRREAFRTEASLHHTSECKGGHARSHAARSPALRTPRAGPPRHLWSGVSLGELGTPQVQRGNRARALHGKGKRRHGALAAVGSTDPHSPRLEGLLRPPRRGRYLWSCPLHAGMLPVLGLYTVLLP